MPRTTTKARSSKGRTTTKARSSKAATTKAATTKAATTTKAPQLTREQNATKIANAALLGGPRPVAEGQSLSSKEVAFVATQLGKAAGTKAALLKACGLTLPQLKGFATGHEEGRGLSGLGEQRAAFEGFYRRVKAANPSPRVRPRKVAAALLGLHATAK